MKEHATGRLIPHKQSPRTTNILKNLFRRHSDVFRDGPGPRDRLRIGEARKEFSPHQASGPRLFSLTCSWPAIRKQPVLRIPPL